MVSPTATPDQIDLPAGAFPAIIRGLRAKCPRCGEVAQLRAQWQGPLLLKGLLHPEDARRAVAMGIDGLIVSNHGGRQLDGAASALEALPAIVAAGEDRIPVLIDGGMIEAIEPGPAISGIANGKTAMSSCSPG